jgi:hypothetical protein
VAYRAPTSIYGLNFSSRRLPQTHEFQEFLPRVIPRGPRAWSGRLTCCSGSSRSARPGDRAFRGPRGHVVGLRCCRDAARPTPAGRPQRHLLPPPTRGGRGCRGIAANARGPSGEAAPKSARIWSNSSRASPSVGPVVCRWFIRTGVPVRPGHHRRTSGAVE